MPRLATVPSAMDTTTVRCLASRHLLNSSGGHEKKPAHHRPAAAVPSIILFFRKNHPSLQTVQLLVPDAGWETKGLLLRGHACMCRPAPGDGSTMCGSCIRRSSGGYWLALAPRTNRVAAQRLNDPALVLPFPWWFMAVSLSILPRPFAICPSGGDQKGCRSLPFNSQTNKQKLASKEENEVAESRTPFLSSN